MTNILATILPPGKTQFCDGNGVPLAGGSLATYIPNTTTPKSSWIDPNQTNLNTNPIILDAAGRCVCYGTGQYTVVLKDVNGNTIYTALTADTSYAGGNTSVPNPTIGTDFVAGGNATQSTQIPVIGFLQHGQCKLVYTNATTVTLIPKNGNNIIINGQVWQIPDAGITATTSGLSATQKGYFYIYNNSGTLALQTSTTGHSAQAGTGIEIMTGNAAYTLVGGFLTNGSTQFSDTATWRGIRSWFNEYGISGSNALSANSDSVTAVAPNYAELAVSAATFETNLFVWQHERISVTFDAMVAATGGVAGNVHSFTGINLTGALTGSGSVPGSSVKSGLASTNAVYYTPLSCTTTFGVEGATFNGGSAVNEGQLTLTMYGAVDAAVVSATYISVRGTTHMSYNTVRSAIT